MADNSTQFGNDTIATDDISSGVAAGAKVPRNKVGFGPDNSYADVEAANPLPVTDTTNAPATSAITALGALNANVQLAIGAFRGVLCDLPAGTLSGTIYPQVFVGSSWQRTHFFDPTITTAGLAQTQLAFTGTVTATHVGIFVPAGATFVRVIVGAHTSGTVNMQISATGAGDAPFSLTTGKIGNAGIPVAGEMIAGKVETTAATQVNGNLGYFSISPEGYWRVELKSSDVHDLPAGTFLVTVGGYASNTIPTAVGVADASRNWVSLNGAQVGAAYVETTPVARTNATTSHFSMSPEGFIRVELKSSDVHDIAAGLYMVTVGGYASNTIPTAVGAADASRNWVSLNGAQIMGAYVETTPAARTNATTSHCSLSPTGYLRVQLESSDVHDQAAGNAMVQTGGTANASAPAAVSSGDAVKSWFSVIGEQHTIDASNAFISSTGALAALNQNVVLDLQGNTSAYVYIATGTLIGTVAIEAYVTGVSGTYSCYIYDVSSGAATSGSIVYAAGTSTTYRAMNLPPGTTHVRVRCSAFTSGTSNVTIFASKAQNGFALWAGATGGNIQPFSVVMGGKVETTAAAQTNGAQAYASFNSDGTGMRVNVNNATGQDAPDAAFTGNPIGVAVLGSSAVPTAMSANNDVTRPWATLNGAMVLGGFPEATPAARTNGVASHVSMNLLGAMHVDTGGQRDATGSITALSTLVEVDVSGMAGATMTIGSGLTGTIRVDFALGASGYASQGLFVDPTNRIVGTTSLVLSGSGTVRSILIPSGSSKVRIICTAYTSGSASVTISASTVVDTPTTFTGPLGTSSLPVQGALVMAKVETIATSQASGGGGFLSVHPTTSGLRVYDVNIVVDNAAFTDGTTPVSVAGFIYDDTAGAALTENDAGAARINPNRAQCIVGEDNTTRGVRWTIKNGNVAAVTTDNALVTTPHPAGTQNTTTTDTVGSAVALTSTATAAIIVMAGRYSASVNIPSGTLIATLIAEASLDGGITYPIATLFDTINGKVPTIASTSGVAVNASIIGVGGATHYRVRPSVFTSGTATATLRATCVFDPSVIFAQPAGATTQPSLAAVAGKVQASMPAALTDATHQPMAIDTQGRTLVGHISPERQVWKFLGVTTAQTGANVWVPTSGKKIAITHIEISTYGTTAGRVILWFAATGTTAFASQQVAFVGSFAPSASSNPGAILQPATPIFCATADFCLKITTATALSADITVYGYEYN